MPTPTDPAPPSAIEAIHQRRSVRRYADQPVDKPAMYRLIDAAVRAPTEMDQEPWAFAIVQEAGVLSRLSNSVKLRARDEAKGKNSASYAHLLRMAEDPEFHVFHNAGTLVVICGKFQGPFVEADCWLAAENFMLAACTEGLGTCVIGFAVEALNTPAWKTELKTPAEMTVIAPIIVGTPASEDQQTPRKPPEILYWK